MPEFRQIGYRLRVNSPALNIQGFLIISLIFTCYLHSYDSAPGRSLLFPYLCHDVSL